MSKFVQIEKSGNPKHATLLNLDHVAKVELSPELSLGPDELPEVNISLRAVENYELAKLKFENREAANRWVLQHLGIEL